MPIYDRTLRYRAECHNFGVDPKTGKPIPKPPATSVHHEERILVRMIRAKVNEKSIEDQKKRVEEAKKYEAEHPDELEDDDWA